MALPGSGHHAAADRENGSIYVAYGEMSLVGTSPRGIASIDPATGRIRTVPVDGTPFCLAVDPAGRVLVSDDASRRLVVVDTSKLEVLDRIELPFQPHQSSISIY